MKIFTIHSSYQNRKRKKVWDLAEGILKSLQKISHSINLWKHLFKLETRQGWLLWHFQHCTKDPILHKREKDAIKYIRLAKEEMNLLSFTYILIEIPKESLCKLISINNIYSISIIYQRMGRKCNFKRYFLIKAIKNIPQYLRIYVKICPRSSWKKVLNFKCEISISI